jgi:4-hydroxybutyrate CoA-transferase
MNLLANKLVPDFSAVAARIPAGGNIVIHSDFAEPAALIKQFVAQAAQYKGVNLYTLMPMDEPAYADEKLAKEWTVNTFFPGSGLRGAVNKDLAVVKRCTLTEIPQLFVDGKIKADMLLLQVSPPNAAGQVSLGVSVDYMPEVLAQKPIVIAQLNTQMPFTHGDTLLALDDIDFVLEHDEPLYEFPVVNADPVDAAIARHVVGLINDGDIVQAGIGALPDAVITNLGHLKHLGVHTGILTPAWMPLIESGVVDNSTKQRFKGKTIATMIGGDQQFYAYVNNNTAIELYPCSLTHSYETLTAIDNMCAVNSVLQMDLQANANAEKVNGRLISTPGGLPDFARGASAAHNGKSIIALRSSFKSGKHSNIVMSLDKTSPATLQASAINFVVTEYGVAQLNGLDENARAQALIAIAHPDHRDSLQQQWQAR